jgi:hypothetical protein
MTSYITDSTPAGDHEKITVAGTATGPSAAKLVINQTGGAKKRAVRAFITVETAPCRIRFDGGTADSSTGHLLVDGDYITIDGESNVANISMIRTSGSSAEVSITYFYNI